MLAALGTVSVGMVAGCSGGGGDGNGDGTPTDEATAGGDGGNNTETEGGSSIEYPTENIVLVVPTTSGGGTDAYARLTESYWEDHLGGDIVVENRPGAGMIVGTGSAYNSASDGHTMVTAEVLNLVSGQIGSDVEYDIRDMSHIGAISQEPNAFVMMDQADVETWDEFVNAAPDLNFATNGRGSNVHINPLALGEMTGEYSPESLNFVHYEGTGETLAGLERGGASAFMVGTLTSAIKVVQALENASMFAIFAEEDEFGDLAENGNVDPNYWLGDFRDMGMNNIEKYADITVFRRFFSGPPGVPDDILAAQREAFSTFTQDDDFLASMRENGRPALNPAGHETLQEAVDSTFNEFTGGRIEELIQQAWG
ncbi:Tripartite-type tricarboxylate transporter, receptor component TctC [Halopenitus malekzadehii]|uniref:Tripartite-type tricarboxylate transporter, receptor component TctC n=1 Tax=Halopenitus malekzadehii TaxID=1267564 RepID=A0A1H6JNZ2_9EURY|nr:tripartite tricarboxylate transporter substrate-binding protein [Halopenitus malekzadehii]SEH64162.1 Tripartite-type tricarboxylate transporter, receptor component TctC [Halopenitus malekzadehii]